MTTVLVHGNPETSAIWRPLVAALTAEGVANVVTLSPPGFGAPTEPDWDASPASYVNWLADRLSYLEKPIDIVGHDWGAGHVFGLLAAYPTIVRSWAADCGGLIHPDYVWHDMAQLWQTPGAGEEAVAGMIQMPVEERQAMYEDLSMPADIAAEMAAAVDEDMGRCVLGLYRGARQPMLAELGARLEPMDLPPGLIIDATEDAYVSTELVPDVVASLGAKHLELAGQGHWWMTSEPAAIQAAVGLASFWGSLN